MTTKETDRGTETRTGDMIEHRRLRVDTWKWMLAKALPKVYGDRLAAELTGKYGQPLQPATDMRELARDVPFIFAKGLQETEQKG